MNVISWNCRGLGNVKAVPCIKDLIRVYKSDVVILIETLVESNKISDLCYTIGFDNHFSVDCIGRSGGLAILWRNSINCSLINYSQNFINMSVQDPIHDNWRLTAFYGYSDSGRHLASWDLLRHLSSL
ncbi:putative endonuclease/exonuclease/phosphatase [Medicago truncatula]|nr:putative endonuclease/exonuclease/phosphatase [Medicago truncatula]